MVTRNLVPKEAKEGMKLTIAIPKDSEVRYNPNTKARDVAVPFIFPDGSNGIAILIKVKNEPWIPYKEVKSLTLTFVNNEKN